MVKAVANKQMKLLRQGSLSAKHYRHKKMK